MIDHLEFSTLRQRAEERLIVKIGPEALSPEEAARLIHELLVHQMELELQNEELREAQARPRESHHQYRDL